MKKILTKTGVFLRSAFWGADPARYAFFALTLWVFGTLTTETWYFLTEMTADRLQFLPAVFFLIFFVAWLRFCCRLLKSRRRFWGWLVVALYALLAAAMIFIHWFTGRSYAYAAAQRGQLAAYQWCEFGATMVIFAVPWLVPLIVLCRQWRYLLLRAGCLAVATWFCFDLYEIFASAEYIRPTAGMLVLAQLKVVSGVALWLAVYWLTAKIYAGAAGLPWRKMFGKGVGVLLWIFLASHLVALGMAVAEHFRAERGFAALEKHFGLSLSPRAMAERYYAGRKADGEFWKRAMAALEETPKWIYQGDFGVEENGAAPPPSVVRRGGEIDASAGLRKLEQMFSAPPPAFVRDYDQPMLWETAEGERELSLPRDFARGELARVCRAVAKRDKPTALAALRRLEIVRDFLVREDLLFCSFIMLTSETARLNALEWLIGAEMLDESELLAERRRLEELDAALAHVEFDFIRGNAGYAAEVMDSFVGTVRKGGKVPPSALAWALPSLWYLHEVNRVLVYKSFLIKRYSECAKRSWRSDWVGELACMVLPHREGGRAFRKLSARYRAAEGLIDAALEKRRTGKYPTTLKNLPTDPFTGKPMKYRFGKVPMRRIVRDEEEGVEKVRFELQPGVAVWSVGANKTDDGGANGHGYSDDRRDDIRALIALPQKP